MLSRDHYAVLGVSPDADAETIESAYRRLCRRYHPDLSPGDAQARAAFARITLAYRVLTDSSARARYDSEGHPFADDLEVIAGAAPASGTQHESFAELFRGLCDHARRSRPQRGSDVHVTVTCRLPDAERGRRTTVEVRRLQGCTHCGARGFVRMGEASACATCRGSGKEVFGRGTLHVGLSCSDCGGEGIRSGSACPQCHASGVVGSSETIAIQIPPGVLAGQELRLAGAGNQGKRGAPAGDLVVTVKVQEHPDFERQGPHLVTRLPISVSEAILGARLSVPTLEGAPAAVRIPPGARPGMRLRVRDKGLEMANGTRGDLLLDVEIWLPEVVDEDSKKLIREFGERTSTPARRPPGRATVQP